MQDIVDSLSKKRIDIYKNYMDCSDDNEAIGLYIWNSNLSKEIANIINIIEVSLRNSIHQSYMNFTSSDENWLVEYFESLDDADEGKKRIKEVKSKISNKKNTSVNDIISRLHFGFWSAICSDSHLESNEGSLKMWPSMLDSVFAGRNGVSQAEIFRMIRDANYTRNRVSHNEVVWKEDKRCGLNSVIRSVQGVCNNLFKLSGIIGVSNVKLIELNGIFDRVNELCDLTVIDNYKNLISNTSLSGEVECKSFDLNSIDEFFSGIVHRIDRNTNFIKIKARDIKKPGGSMREFSVDRNETQALIAAGIKRGDNVRFIPKYIPNSSPPFYGAFIAFTVSISA